jgi:FMN phosphatase YigB (HAD superfamily)
MLNFRGTSSSRESCLGRISRKRPSYPSTSLLIIRLCRNPNAYLGAIHHLALKVEEVAMVTSHPFDLRGAAAVGMPTIYIPRLNLEGPDPEAENMKSKAEGGEADLVVSSFTEMVEALARLRKE